MERLTLEAVKRYMRIDTDDEDDLINELIEYSKEEIKNSTGDDGANPSYTYKMAQLLIITDRFENRGSDDKDFKVNNALSCLFTKLKFRRELNADTGEQATKQG